MNSYIMLLFVVVSGIGIASQSAMSAQLAKLVGHPMLATFTLYGVSTIVMAIAIFVLQIDVPGPTVLKDIPIYLWFSGSLLSIVALSTVYWVMPQVGAGRVMSGVVAGQIMTSMIAAHLGWFSLPIDAITVQKMIGALLLIGGVVLINGGR